MLRAVFIGFFLCLVSSLPVEAAKRAFVVGIDRYDNLASHAQLQRAVNDARSVATALGALGYEVALHPDVSRSAFNAAWQSFLNAVRPGDEVALFYSGHGIEIDGQNYLLPRNIPNVHYGRETQVKRESISLQELLADLRSRRPQVSLIILDACRDHPLASPDTRSLSRSGGLANVQAPEGTFIMYSAGAGETALDRLPDNDPDPTNSVYTRHLLPLLRTPGLSLTEMAVRLRQAVYELASPVPHQQRPAYYDGVIGRYCVAGCGAAGGGALPPQPKVPRPPQVVSLPRASVSRDPVEPRCIELGRDLERNIVLSVGQMFCDKGSRNRAVVDQIINRYVVFLVNGTTRLTCRQGDLCAFDWPVKPLFRVEARADAARGVAPTAQMQPR